MHKILEQHQLLVLVEVTHEHKELRSLRGYFGPPMRPKNEIGFSPNSS